MFYFGVGVFAHNRQHFFFKVINSIVPLRVTRTTGQQLECSSVCYFDYGGTVGDIQVSDTRYQVSERRRTKQPGCLGYTRCCGLVFVFRYLHFEKVFRRCRRRHVMLCPNVVGRGFRDRERFSGKGPRRFPEMGGNSGGS